MKQTFVNSVLMIALLAVALVAGCKRSSQEPAPSPSSSSSKDPAEDEPLRLGSVPKVRQVAADGEFLYLLASGNAGEGSRVIRMNRSHAGKFEELGTLQAKSEESMMALVGDDVYLTWGNAVWAVPKKGGAARAVYTPEKSLHLEAPLAFDGQKVWWVEHEKGTTAWLMSSAPAMQGPKKVTAHQIDWVRSIQANSRRVLIFGAKDAGPGKAPRRHVFIIGTGEGEAAPLDSLHDEGLAWTVDATLAGNNVILSRSSAGHYGLERWVPRDESKEVENTDTKLSRALAWNGNRVFAALAAKEKGELVVYRPGGHIQTIAPTENANAVVSTGDEAGFLWVQQDDETGSKFSAWRYVP